MASSPINPTALTPPRVEFLDPRTGAISREWYRFFLSLLTATQTNQDETTLAPDTVSLLASYDAMLMDLAQETQTTPPPPISEIAELAKQVDGLALTPAAGVGEFLALVPTNRYVPVTKTADFTVDGDQQWIINNKAGSTCTATLPTASAYPGRKLTFQNYQDQYLVSASSNVVPQAGGSAGTAILENVAGNWATLVSDGTNWVIMQAAPYNIMLI